MIDLNDPDERAAAIGEYVLGTLDADDHAAFEAALAQDASLQAQTYRWQDKLLGLTALAAPVVPPEGMWGRIERALESAPPAGSGATTRVASGVVAPAPARPAPARAPAPTATPWWQRLPLWQGLSVAGLAASLLLAVLLAGRVGVPEAPGARYLAVLQSPDNRATGYVVEMQARGTLRLIPLGQPLAVPAGRSLQFWTKAQTAAGPTSLGLVRPGEVVQLPVSRLPAVEAEQLFEITLEPEAGSPLDRPTGPILFVGRTVAI